MNFAYFRKSKFSFDKTVSNLKKLAVRDWKILGEVDLPDKKGKMVLICRPEWAGAVSEENYQLLGFLPCSVSVIRKGKDVLIGTASPAVIKALSQSKIIADIATVAEKMIKDLIHESAGVKELKPKSVKLYSTMSCPYCKMEKSWLEEKKVKHDVVFVDLNPEEAQKMVDKTGQMGVPVTEVEFEEGESEFVVGFDKGKLSSLLGVQQ